MLISFSPLHLLIALSAHTIQFWFNFHQTFIERVVSSFIGHICKAFAIRTFFGIAIALCLNAFVCNVYKFNIVYSLAFVKKKKFWRAFAHCLILPYTAYLRNSSLLFFLCNSRFKCDIHQTYKKNHYHVLCIVELLGFIDLVVWQSCYSYLRHISWIEWKWKVLIL